MILEFTRDFPEFEKFNPVKDFQSDQIQRSSRKIITAHYSCRIDTSPVTEGVTLFKHRLLLLLLLLTTVNPLSSPPPPSLHSSQAIHTYNCTYIHVFNLESYTVNSISDYNSK